MDQMSQIGHIDSDKHRMLLINLTKSIKTFKTCKENRVKAIHMTNLTKTIKDFSKPLVKHTSGQSI